MGLNIEGFDLGIELPKVSTAGIGALLMWIAIFIIFLLVGAIIIYVFVYQKKIYNKRVEIYENIGGLGYRKVGIDLARVVKFGNFGDEVLFLKKRKVYRSACGRKMDRNTYWFVVGPDGYWYNFVLGDLDTQTGILDIEPVDTDVKMIHVGIAKNIEKNYTKLNVMEKYGALIISGVVLVILLIGIWINLSKLGDIATISERSISFISPVAEALTKAAANLDNICSGGSGIHTVG